VVVACHKIFILPSTAPTGGKSQTHSLDFQETKKEDRSSTILLARRWEKARRPLESSTEKGEEKHTFFLLPLSLFLASGPDRKVLQP